MIVISTKEQFSLMLKDERALLFLWVDWGYAQVAQPIVIQLHEQWNEAHPDSMANLYRVDLSDVTPLGNIVCEWIKSHAASVDVLGLTVGGWGALIWVRAGYITDYSINPRVVRLPDLLMRTQKAFDEL